MAVGFGAWRARLMGVAMGAAVAAGGLAPGSMALAAGGAHVVEDSEPEEPGQCHVDTWVARQGRHDGSVVVSPACTFAGLPRLELSAAVQRGWGDDRDTLAGPGFKYNLLPASDGVGLALAGGGVWSTRDGHADNAWLVVPLTVPLTDAWKVHLNAGLAYTHDRGRRHQSFVGAQVEYALTSQVSLMAEVFDRDGDPLGSQAGLRWTPGQGDVDIDLLYGRRLDVGTARTVTLGVTFRF
jgi:hypothetical protein